MSRFVNPSLTYSFPLTGCLRLRHRPHPLLPRAKDRRRVKCKFVRDPNSPNTYVSTTTNPNSPTSLPQLIHILIPSSTVPDLNLVVPLFCFVLPLRPILRHRSVLPHLSIIKILYMSVVRVYHTTNRLDPDSSCVRTFAVNARKID
jgi:hypothetical protein